MKAIEQYVMPCHISLSNITNKLTHKKLSGQPGTVDDKHLT